MAYLSVDEQVEEITATAIERLGIPRADVEAMIAKRNGDRLALNRLRVDLNRRHTSACADMDRRAETADAEARAAAAWLKHDGNLEQAARDRRATRERQTYGARIDQALTALDTMSTVRAARLDAVRVSGSTDETPPPARAERRTEQKDVTDLLAGIAYLTEQLELVLDAARGVATPQSLAKLSGEAKDEIILTQLRGVHADTIAQTAPWLGGSRTIRNLRRENGQRPVDGTDALLREFRSGT